MTEWLPKDNIYGKYSLSKDLLRTAKEERSKLEKRLSEYEIIASDVNLQLFAETISYILEIINEDQFKEEVEEYKEIIRGIEYAGASIPLDLLFSKDLASYIIIFSWLWNNVGKKVGKKVYDLFLKDMYEKLKSIFLRRSKTKEMESIDKEKLVRIHKTVERMLEMEEGQLLIERTTTTIEIPIDAES